MNSCKNCGTNPVPHNIHKFYESLDIFMGPTRRKLDQSLFGRVLDKAMDKTALGLFFILKPIGLVKLNNDISKVPYPRAKVLWEEANARGLGMQEIKPFNQSIDLYRAKIKNKYFYFMNLPRKESISSSNLAWVDDKFLLKKKFLEHNIPVAKGGAFTTLASTLKAFDALDKPLIVKPRAGSRGRHTTTLVSTKEDLVKAFHVAKQLCHWVIVEEHLFGDVQRATIVGGKLIGVLGGSPPQVTGDGQSTIAQLIKMNDQTRHQKVKETKINPFFLERQGFDLNTILAPGQTIPLSEKIGVNYGGTSYDATKQIHPDTIAMLEQAAKILDVSILGFDFIIPDLTKSYKEQKCGIIECNGAPFINLHHDVLIGEPINVAKHVWDLVETK